MKFSIIVPVYGVEKYIIRCIKSILNQSYTNLEIIIVDDETPDDSIKIVRESFMDNRIQIVSQKNGGLSSARNYGLKYAKGNYLWFIDSDDYISDLQALEKLANTIVFNNQPDIVVFNNTVIFEDQTSDGWLNINAPVSTVSLTGYDYIATFTNMPINAWTQIYEKSFFMSNHFLFPDKMYFEDIFLNLDIYLKAQSVVGINEFFINYIKREDSIMTKKFNINHYKSQIKVLLKFDHFLKKSLLDKKYLSKRIQYEYTFLKAIYESCKNDILDQNICIDSGMVIPGIYKEPKSTKFEKRLFKYFPDLVLNNITFFKKLNHFENKLTCKS
ncbi:glycosyltransferase family 2 protein [Empedobacter brevis]|uniref:Glycosyl transferase n=2 Tax=Empedobacter brevis TaxID=247 RepID=A0A511NIS2_9FLAO|nr:glycosyltransferase family 2 protein [Empedobacter brevis]MDM1073037.1 glycosyltransferase family 2 protein [Empedobacter brevis]GEM52388.1 glycosyl transferase [Empedobacter brevis NBRC 14943 = ATCC 43319]